MVEMNRSSVLVEKKPTYSQVLQNNTKYTSSMTKDSNKYLNGEISFFGRKERSNSECSSDSQLDSLLEVADKIKDGKHEGFKKPKKRVHFNMDKNEEFTYSYSSYNESLDEESAKSRSNALNNINFVGIEYMNGFDKSDDESNDDDDDDNDDNNDDDDDDDNEDSDEEDDDDEEDTDDNETDTETSEEGTDHGLGKYGFLVDKSSEKGKEMSNGNDEATNILTGKTSDSMELNHISYEVNGDGITDDQNKQVTASQIKQLEMALKSRKEEVEEEMSDLTQRLNKTRRDTLFEMKKLEEEVTKRRAEYKTEIDEINRTREEQKRKFEKELEEFQNEKMLEERRQRYYEHERIITEKEQHLDRRKTHVMEQEEEIRECEEYLNRRHKLCNSKEEDLNILQNELETLAQELEAKKERLLNKSRVYQHQLENVEEPPAHPDIPMRTRSPSRISTESRGVDWRIDELKSQNKQLLEELFTLKKTLECKEEDFEEIRQTVEVLESDNKRLLQKVKNLESQLEVARKSAALSSDALNPPLEDILRKTATDLRKSRVSRVSRVTLEPLSLESSQSKMQRTISKESVQLKAKSSNSSDSGKEEKSLQSSSKSGSKTSDEKHVNKKGGEKITSSLCLVM